MCLCGFCNVLACVCVVWASVCVWFVCMCVGFAMCGCFGNMYTVRSLRFFFTLTEGFPCYFLSCNENARVKLGKRGHGPHSSKLVVNCVVPCIVCV